MKEKKTEELYLLNDCGPTEKKPNEYPRKWKIKTVALLKSTFKLVMIAKFVFGVINKIWTWFSDM
ncbi:MAG: hypothetical protein V4843_09300 [Pseudomonadota bacterium]